MGPTPEWHLAQDPIHFPVSPYFAVHFCNNKRKRNENHSSAININFDHESYKNPKCIHFVVFIPHFLTGEQETCASEVLPTTTIN